MRWMIGLDLGARSRGTLQLAEWLSNATRGDAVQQFVAVHVIDEELQRLLRTDLMEELVLRSGKELDATIDASSFAPAVIGRRIVTSGSPEHALAAILATDPCDAIVIGRIASGSERTRLVRLGRVARRLLRRLPRPVVVAPPDLTSASLGSGPLLLTTDLGDASRPAAAFAARLAADLGRDIAVVHVDAGYTTLPTFWGEPLVVPAPPRRIPADVDDWAKSVGLGSAHTLLAEGDLVENVLDIAKRQDAPLIVCGSRGLSTFDRIFTSSAAMDLARLADRPVAVVPSH
jgi:nucleotide-binding universal stress UspA family protein